VSLDLLNLCPVVCKASCWMAALVLFGNCGGHGGTVDSIVRENVVCCCRSLRMLPQVISDTALGAPRKRSIKGGGMAAVVFSYHYGPYSSTAGKGCLS
jgi:hypothetical protein